MAQTVAELRAKLGLDVKEFNSRLAQSQKKVKGMGKSMSKLGSIAGGIAAPMLGAFAISAVVGSAFKSIKEFGKELSSLSAITGAVGDDLKAFEEASLAIGRSSTVSAIEAIKAFKLLASAKPELLENRDALISLTKEAVVLSEAAGIDLATAAEQLGSALNAMNLPANESTRIINTLAAASQKGAKEIPFINDALSKFGGIAAQAGIEIETSVAAIEILGKVIPEASIVGNNLKNIMIILQTEAAEQGRAFEGLSKELDRLSPKVKDITLLEEMFGKENLLAAQTLIAEREEIVKLETAITGTNTAFEQQATNTKNLASDMLKLGNAWEGFVLKMKDSEGLLSSVLGHLTGILNQITRDQNNLTQSTKEFSTEQEKLVNFWKTSIHLAEGMGASEERLFEMSVKLADAQLKLTESQSVYNDSLATGNAAVMEGIAKYKAAKKAIADLAAKKAEDAAASDAASAASKKALADLAAEAAKAAAAIGPISDHVVQLAKEMRLLKEVEFDLPQASLLAPMISDLDRATIAARAMSAAFDENPEQILKRQLDILRRFSEQAIETSLTVTPEIQKIIDRYKALTKTMKESGTSSVDLTDNIKESAQEATKAIAAAQQVTSLISNIKMAEHEVEINKITEKYNKERDLIQRSGRTEEEKTRLLADLSKKETALKLSAAKKQAESAKETAIFTAVINMAAGVVRAFGEYAYPIALGISALVVAAGAAQISVINSQPIPSAAEGGLALSPTLAVVGDNPGPHPEVIAPLDKLQNMLNNNVTVTIQGIVRGEDLILIQDRVNSRLNFIR